MDYTNLGRTGLRVSRLCLGMMSFGKHESREWALDEAAAEPIVRRAVEGGVTFFDTADVYNGGQSEVVTGSLLKKLFGMREEYVVATKVHGRTMPGENGRGLSRKHILASIDASLERLGTRLRRPLPDPPLGSADADRGDDGGAARRREGGQGALHRGEQHVGLAVREGPARRADPVRLDAEPLQPRLPRGGAGDDPAVHRPGRGGGSVEPARPRAAGGYPDTRGRTAHNARPKRPLRGQPLHARGGLRRRRPASEVAADRGVPTAQVALAWLLHKPGVTAPIVGATRAEHLDDALAAEELALSDEEIARLEEPYVPHKVSGITI